ncbi:MULTISPECIES: sigma-54-dependent Fis family transcriptional regulator [Pseudonocardia]|uniref:Transcriptional regulatory protein ZraR n=2 Tax=Pseudonocardia TaxID=1847 RepID=A0A1Y2MPF0_PSEAH|nr:MULTISPECIES: helix-turn-helix domain-containing protein [Pseudonocardia]OSY36348.1 Transcriptional regulatory protein ZraR [Pseudonocardia autotrophica]TDN72696.1 transcriptional regulator of acetoin/glycerol metabolism [Pseudonocardia autotrophica]BBG03407.1 Fis family transcriptional regulator [Pseudonocardia autotrophica]GEC27238.1 Fis family transcriptional regulator [Pseudonocardia saturnea]
MTTRSVWELFQSGEEPGDLRGDVLTSWRRSRFSGVDPEYVDVPYVETDIDSSFARVAVPIMTEMAGLLVGDRSCLALSDEHGSVIWRWVSEPMLRGTLDNLSVIEGFCFGEEYVGTNGLGTALETGALAVVHGTEHYVQRFHDVTCVAAPVRHPITRRTVGAVNVTCRAGDANHLLVVVVRKLVEEIRTAMLDQASIRERHLLDAFLAEQRRGSGPVAVIGEGVLITNSEAADIGLDRLDIWDELRSPRSVVDGTSIDLPADLTARVRLVRAGGTTAGALLTVSAQEPAAAVPGPRRRPAPEADPWSAAADRAARLIDSGPVAVRGEAGTGKATALGTVLGPHTTVDAAMQAVDGPGPWIGRLRAALDEGAVLLRHVEMLDPATARAAAAVLAGRSPIGLTVTVGDGEVPGPSAAMLLDALGAGTVSLPSLRSRPDDVAALARTQLRRHGEGLSFAPDALAALRRHDWPGNLAELARVVRDAVAEDPGPVLPATALPDGIRAAAARRALSPLERAEAQVIRTVLGTHGGNKSTAARELGISRTALYAKIRSYRL